MMSRARTHSYKQ